MQKLLDYWAERSAKQKLTLGAAFLLTFLVTIGFSVMASRPNMALLYGGLDAAEAGEVVAGIERAGVVYEVRGDAIWVDSAERDQLRVELASQGLPATGGAGYELLDGMSGFGTTAQMFDAAYWRAKEGELARTILALPNIKTARVHLAVENGRGYRREFTGSASATLTTNGGPVSREQAAALKHLISSGVPGMPPETVTIIDTRHGIIAADEDRGGADRAAEMKRNVERILESHVGIGNAIVELNLDIETDSEQLVEQRFDPDQRALISQVTEESTDQSNSTGSGAVTAASNLPEGDEAAGDSSESTRSENRQQTNYEVSTVTREVSRQPGTTRRLSVAVLVNGIAQPNADGDSEIVPRSEAELQTLYELVASAVGYEEARGDIITVKSLPFAALVQEGTLAQSSFIDRLELNSLARIAIIGLFTLIVMFIVMRVAARAGQPTLAPPVELDESSNLPDLGNDFAPMTVSSFDENMMPSLALGDFLPQPTEESEPMMFPDQLALPPADPVARLRTMMRDRQEESIKILAGWIENKESAS